MYLRLFYQKTIQHNKKISTTHLLLIAENSLEN